VLLIEAGDDQGTNVNYTVPAFNAKATEDDTMSWDFWVRHYADDARQQQDYKLTYDLPGGGEYTGLDPPPGATIKGVLYPRTATLGGCTAHNALVSVYPDQDDFQNIATLTGDNSWKPNKMRNFFKKMERVEYLEGQLGPGHGHTGWLGIDVAPATLALKDLQLLGMITGALTALGGLAETVLNIGSFLLGDPNADNPFRDSTQAIYQIPMSSSNGARNGVREFLVSVAGAKNWDGTPKYQLDIRTNCLVTKVDFDTSGPTPQATGVSFLDGANLYRADPRAGQGSSGTPGSATASREVIVAGGSYNSPQILKLSGVGPAAELESFGIPVVKDLPGVGANLQDHYEVAVQGLAATNFTILNGCTFDRSQPDQCLETWQDGSIALDRGTYVSNGFVAAMFIKSSQSPDNNYDEFAFGGPVDFRGYFPGYSINATDKQNVWTWAMLKSHPRNTAGTVELVSADPLDPPKITFNYVRTLSLAPLSH
jgi:choline dehydrogenase